MVVESSPQPHSKKARWAIVGLVALVAGVVLWGIWRAATSSARIIPQATKVEEAAAAVPFDLEKARPKIVSFCGGCHPFSEPRNFPKQAWKQEVDRGYKFHFDLNEGDVGTPVPPIQELYAFFEQQAPDRLDLGSDIVSQESETLKFRKEPLPLAEPHPGAAIAHLKWADVEWNGRRPVLLCCDMVSGDVYGDSGPPTGLRPRKIASYPFSNPAHIEPTDLDGDQKTDFVVGDLGSPFTADHANGKVVWLRSSADGSLEPFVLAAEMGRVADVEPADFDKDGDQDLVVAEFGGIRTGGIRVLWNQGIKDGVPQFKDDKIDKRHGTVCVPVVDLNGDGFPDFLAAISQEFEVVDAFLNNKDGTFVAKRLFTAGNPSFALTDIQPVDLDGDGDLDVVIANGDTFDTQWAKPYQGLYWLENSGKYPFTAHQLATFPGAMRVRTGDLDGDGDLDIVLTGLLSPDVFQNQVETQTADSIVWLEQTARGVFQRHRVEGGNVRHAALEVIDFDGDGDLDLLVGGLNYRGLGYEPALTLWRNLRIDAGQ